MAQEVAHAFSFVFRVDIWGSWGIVGGPAEEGCEQYKAKEGLTSKDGVSPFCYLRKGCSSGA